MIRDVIAWDHQWNKRLLADSDSTMAHHFKEFESVERARRQRKLIRGEHSAPGGIDSFWVWAASVILLV